jgi:hypothetical protein
MSEQSQVSIELRMPSPWETPDDFAQALNSSNSAYKFHEGWLIHRTSGWRCECLGSAHDDEIAELFEHDGRLGFRELKEIDAHKTKVHLAGPGGSVETARAMMDAAAAVVRAGAFGVMVDNSGNTHGKKDFLKLAEDREPGGMYWFYVASTGDRAERELFSTGMHCLGFRDAELPDVQDPQQAWLTLNNFLGYCYQSGVPISDGDPCGDEDEPQFRVRHLECHRVPRGTPFYNPFGVWRLDPYTGEDEDEDVADDD